MIIGKIKKIESIKNHIFGAEIKND